jgi:hypothetical protein
MNIEGIIKNIKDNPIEKNGELYHPIPFPEFNGLKISSNPKGVFKKWDLISNTLKIIFSDKTNFRVLDVGANAGFYTFNFAKNGASVKSFECHDRYKDIGRIIAKEKKLPVEWNSKAFQSNSIQKDEQFDVALLLSVYQWMSNGDINDKEAKASLKLISDQSDYLFFELGYNNGKSCVRTTKWFHYAEMIRFLQESTSYLNFKLIGKTKLWGGQKRYLILCSNNPNMEDKGWSAFLRKFKF